MKEVKTTAAGMVAIGFLLAAFHGGGIGGCGGEEIPGGGSGSESEQLTSVSASLKNVLTKVCPSRDAPASVSSSNSSNGNCRISHSNNSNYGDGNRNIGGNSNICRTGSDVSVSNLSLSEEEATLTIGERTTEEAKRTTEEAKRRVEEATSGAGGQRTGQFQCVGTRCESTTSYTPSNSSTRAISEQDEGNTVAAGTKLNVKNIAGTVYVEPSTDGKVSWAARKWVSADTKANADAAMKDIKITSTNDKGEVQVVVGHPSGGTSLYYNTCIVVRAPADGALEGETKYGNVKITQKGKGEIVASTGSGKVEIDTNADGGSIKATSDYGDVKVVQKGPGNVTASSKNGHISLETESNGGTLKGETKYGDITISQKGSGPVTASTTNGKVSVSGDSRGGVNLSSDYGDVTCNLSKGSATLQNDSTITTKNGNVVLNVANGVGHHIYSSVTSGKISIPNSYTSVVSAKSGRSEIVTAIGNGGGEKTLRLESEYGNISVNVTH